MATDEQLAECYETSQNQVHNGNHLYEPMLEEYATLEI